MVLHREDGQLLVGHALQGAIDQQWQAVSFGGAEISKEIQNIAKTWTKESGYHFRFIRIYQAQSDFMEILCGSDSLGFAPLQSAKVALAIESFEANPSQLLHNSEIIEPLREMVKKNISAEAHSEKIQHREN